MANQLGCTKHLAEKSFKINQNGGEKELFVRQIVRLNFTTSPTSQKKRHKKGENILWKFLQSRKRDVSKWRMLEFLTVSAAVAVYFSKCSINLDLICICICICEERQCLFLELLNQFEFILYLYLYLRGATVSFSRCSINLDLFSSCTCICEGRLCLFLVSYYQAAQSTGMISAILPQISRHNKVKYL